jgi:hypothetical protein
MSAPQITTAHGLLFFDGMLIEEADTDVVAGHFNMTKVELVTHIKIGSLMTMEIATYHKLTTGARNIARMDAQATAREQRFGPAHIDDTVDRMMSDRLMHGRVREVLIDLITTLFKAGTLNACQIETILEDR